MISFFLSFFSVDVNTRCIESKDGGAKIIDSYCNVMKKWFIIYLDFLILCLKIIYLFCILLLPIHYSCFNLFLSFFFFYYISMRKSKLPVTVFPIGHLCLHIPEFSLVVCCKKSFSTFGSKAELTPSIRDSVCSFSLPIMSYI